MDCFRRVLLPLPFLGSADSVAVPSASLLGDLGVSAESRGCLGGRGRPDFGVMAAQSMVLMDFLGGFQKMFGEGISKTGLRGQSNSAVGRTCSRVKAQGDRSRLHV